MRAHSMRFFCFDLILSKLSESGPNEVFVLCDFFPLFNLNFLLLLLLLFVVCTQLHRIWLLQISNRYMQLLLFAHTLFKFVRRTLFNFILNLEWKTEFLFDFDKYGSIDIPLLDVRFWCSLFAHFYHKLVCVCVCVREWNHSSFVFIPFLSPTTTEKCKYEINFHYYCHHQAEGRRHQHAQPHSLN